METITTPLTTLLGIKHPIMLAGMNVAAGPKLAAAVTNAGGIGVIGGHGYTPKILKKQIATLKKHLVDPNAPFGIDLLIPQVGGSARKTNYDYQDGKLPQLIDVIVASGAKLFVCAVGVPPRWVVDKLHAAGIVCMNMIGSPRHVPKALAAGVDMICAQGGEGGGHTGEIATSILIPAVVDLCRSAVSPLTNQPVIVVAAGGIFDGRGLAMSLALGASGVWVGTRFVACKEAGASKRHKAAVLATGPHDTMRSLIYTGRPLRICKNEYALEWENKRSEEMKALLAAGKLPIKADFEAKMERGEEITPDIQIKVTPQLMGQVAGVIDDIKSAKEIVDQMMSQAITVIRGQNQLISRL
jgi:NAD(P)H-dependent flavin oxidoreductase YrpB (nitropropane dioxygenase family)